jgi:hypothetical protein
MIRQERPEEVEKSRMAILMYVAMLGDLACVSEFSTSVIREELRGRQSPAFLLEH